MRSTAALSLLAFVAVATATQLQSNNPQFSSGLTGCISASNAVGAPVTIQSCLVSGDLSSQNWNVMLNGVPQQLRVFSNMCLDVINGVNADGTKLQVFTCTPGNTNQLWIPLSDATFQWAGTNKCIDLTDGNINPGNQLQVWTCDSLNTNQHWSPFTSPPTGSVSRLRAIGAPSTTGAQCLVASANADGAAVSLDVCGSPAAGANDTWVFPASGTSGPISTFGGTKCLDVTNGNPTNGNLVQAFTCVPGNTNQMWMVNGPAGSGTISWTGHNKCLNVKDGIFNASAKIQIWDCDPANVDPNQHWSSQ